MQFKQNKPEDGDEDFSLKLKLPDVGGMLKQMDLRREHQDLMEEEDEEEKKKGQKPKPRQKTGGMICCCGAPGCRIGPMEQKD